MNNLYSFTIDQYLEIIQLAKAVGKKPGDKMTEEMEFIANKYNITPSGATELNMKELKKEYESKGKKVLTQDDLEKKS